MISGVNIRGKANVASVNGAVGSGHLDWLKVDLNPKQLLFKTVHAQKINVNGSTHI